MNRTFGITWSIGSAAHGLAEVSDVAILDPLKRAADWLILRTSLDRADVPAEELAALYRVRCQVEIAFKRSNSILHIDRLV